MIEYATTFDELLQATRHPCTVQELEHTFHHYLPKEKPQASIKFTVGSTENGEPENVNMIAKRQVPVRDDFVADSGTAKKRLLRESMEFLKLQIA